MMFSVRRTPGGDGITIFEYLTLSVEVRGVGYRSAAGGNSRQVEDLGLDFHDQTEEHSLDQT